MNIASIDIGTNTVLLLIAKADLKNKTFNPLLNEHRMPRLGKGVTPGSKISEDKIMLLQSIMQEYKMIIESYNVEKVILTATNVFRIASNSKVILDRIRYEFDYDVKVISGEEEAFYSFLGATSDIKNRNEFLVIDIGGGSTEIIIGSRNTLSYKKSFQIGAVSATEKFLTNDPPSPEQVERLKSYLEEIFSELMGLSVMEKYPVAIAGTPTTLSAIKHNMKSFDEKIIELSELNLFEINEIIVHLSKLTSKEIYNKYPKIMKGREDIILAGSIILLQIMKIININKVFTSTRGIRYGAIFKYLQDAQG